MAIISNAFPFFCCAKRNFLAIGGSKIEITLRTINSGANPEPENSELYIIVPKMLTDNDTKEKNSHMTTPII